MTFFLFVAFLVLGVLNSGCSFKSSNILGSSRFIASKARCPDHSTSIIPIQTHLYSTREPFDRNKRTIGPPPPINEYIKADKVRLIAPKPDSDIGEDIMLGIFTLKDALIEAEKLELDLVMINDKADPPVCKIIDYGKFKYTVEKKKKENAKKQIKGDIKEVKMSYKIDQHDFDVRVRAVQRFLGDGDRVCYYIWLSYIIHGY